MIYPLTPENIKKAAALLASGETLAFPTETVYGLGANAFNAEAVAKIFEIKGRPSFNPLIVHLYCETQLQEVIDLNASVAALELLDKIKIFWPGPLSLVLPKNPRIPAVVTAGLDTVAVRFPSHPGARALLEACKFPVAAPSANLSNRVSPTTAQHVLDELGDRVDFILDGGACQVGLESTVLSLVESPPRLLRPGAITLEDLTSHLGKIESGPAPHQQHTPQGLPSPGMLKRHYAPRTKIVLRGQIEPKDYPPKVGLISFGGTSADSNGFTIVTTISHHQDLDEVASKLFGAIHAMDNQNLDLIVVDTCAEKGLGLAIMDRLKRAAA
ncbi:MAG: threonylcarbamoyl-AMP synthase [Deltaproteobacteria bacterium]|nr:threonylcarbamoyl-AMP synthase [Deltaproteobacteria bacterium]